MSAPVGLALRDAWTWLTLKHVAFTVLCGAAFWMHLTFRVPTRFLFLALPAAALALSLLSLTVVLKRVLSRAASDNPYRQVFATVDRWATGVVLVFLVASAVVVGNGALDRSPASWRRTEVASLGGAEVDLGARVSYAWATLRAWDSDGLPTRVLLTRAERELLWEGRGVAVKTHRGYLGIAWVERVEPDWEWLQREILRQAPDAVQAWQNLIGRLLEERRLSEASTAIQQYLARFPESDADARTAGAEFAWAGRPADVIAILGPRASRPPDYEIYDLLGHALVQVGRHAEGISLLDSATRLAPRRWEAPYHLALAHITAGEPSRAVPLLERVLALRPDFPEVQDQLRRRQGR